MVENKNTIFYLSPWNGGDYFNFFENDQVCQICHGKGYTENSGLKKYPCGACKRIITSTPFLKDDHLTINQGKTWHGKTLLKQ